MPEDSWVRRSTRKRKAVYNDDNLDTNDDDLQDDDESSETPDQLKAKVDKLCNMLKEANGSVCVFTGAGISRAAGLATYRGKGGLWVTNAKQQSTNTHLWFPTYTHLALNALVEAKLVKYIITSNCDSLHRMTGISDEQLIEIHGNCFREKCRNCNTLFTRDYVITLPTSPTVYENLKKRKKKVKTESVTIEPKKEEETVTPIPKRRRRFYKNQAVQATIAAAQEESIAMEEKEEMKSEAVEPAVNTIEQPSSILQQQPAHSDSTHLTGRKCENCKVGDLEDVIINFGESVRDDDWETAMHFAESCKLMLVLGTSLKVAPTNLLALQSDQLVICNLQRTAYHEEADLVMRSTCDEMMRQVMSHNLVDRSVSDYTYNFSFYLNLDDSTLSLSLIPGTTCNIVKSISFGTRSQLCLKASNKFTVTAKRFTQTTGTVELDSEQFSSKLRKKGPNGKMVNYNQCKFPIHFPSISGPVLVKLNLNTSTCTWTTEINYGTN